MIILSSVFTKQVQATMDDKSVETLGCKIRFSSVLQTVISRPSRSITMREKKITEKNTSRV